MPCLWLSPPCSCLKVSQEPGFVIREIFPSGNGGALQAFWIRSLWGKLQPWVSVVPFLKFHGDMPVRMDLGQYYSMCWVVACRRRNVCEAPNFKIQPPLERKVFRRCVQNVVLLVPRYSDRYMFIRQTNTMCHNRSMLQIYRGSTRFVLGMFTLEGVSLSNGKVKDSVIGYFSWLVGDRCILGSFNLQMG